MRNRGCEPPMAFCDLNRYLLTLRPGTPNITGLRQWEACGQCVDGFLPIRRHVCQY